MTHVIQRPLDIIMYVKIKKNKRRKEIEGIKIEHPRLFNVI